MRPAAWVRRAGLQVYAKNQIEAQRSGFDLERRNKGAERMTILKKIVGAKRTLLRRRGGERGIRTLERVLAVTRFPIVRLRPAQPSLHGTVRDHWTATYIISVFHSESSLF